MTTGTYDRYGLTSNPFRELAAESLADVEIYHVRTRIDEALTSIKEEVLEKENRAVVALVGPLGAGKTQRLLLAASEGRERKAFTVYFEVTQKTAWVLKGLAQEIQEVAKTSGQDRDVLLPFLVPRGRRPAVPEGHRLRPGQGGEDHRQGAQRERAGVPPPQ